MRIINRKAKFDYEVLERFEFGIVLLSSEIKAIREGKAHFNDAYVGYKNPHMWLYAMHIGQYKNLTHEPKRDRIILLKRKARKRLITKIQAKGLTLIPLELFFNRRGWAKIVCGLCLGKKLFDKRRSIKEKESRREKERVLKRFCN